MNQNTGTESGTVMTFLTMLGFDRCSFKLVLDEKAGRKLSVNQGWSNQRYQQITLSDQVQKRRPRHH